MLTSQQVLEELLLSGRRVDKFVFLHESGSVCLAQRILDIRQTLGWNIRSRAIKGKGALREYWLEPEEILRIKAKESIAKRDLVEVEQLANELEKAVEMPSNEPEKQEQLGLGMPWE